MGNTRIKARVIINLVLALLTCKKLRNERGKNGRVDKRFLYIPKTIFDDDIRSISQAGENIEFIALRKRFLKKAVRGLITKGYTEYNYPDEIQAGSIDDAVIARKYMKYFLYLMRNLYRIDGIITGAYYYVEQRELAKAAKDIGMEFIALHKECITTPISRMAREIVFKERSGPFYGTILMTYNEEEMSTLLNASEGQEIKSYITGSPRLDKLFEIDQDECKRNKYAVTFFMFEINTYLPVYRGEKLWQELQMRNLLKADSWNWEKTLDEYIESICKFVDESDNLKICIKTKQGAKLDERLRSLGRSHNNVDIVCGGSGGSLLKSSEVVVGFNSTVLIEALAAKKKVLTLGFGEADESEISGQLGVLDLGGAVTKAKSGEELRNQIHRLLASNESLERNDMRDQVLDRYIGTHEPNASLKVYNILASL